MVNLESKLGVIDIIIVSIYLIVIVIVGLLASYFQSYMDNKLEREDRERKQQQQEEEQRRDEIDDTELRSISEIIVDGDDMDNNNNSDMQEQQQENEQMTPTGENESRQKSFDSFFLGGKNLPWWALACSGMSSNLDVSGTMINVALLYAFGVSGMWIELRGGLTLSLCFALAFMAKWYRRSDVATSSEWMILRFGNGREGSIARLCTVIAMLLLAIGNITYFSVGSGKFVAEFFAIPDLIGIKKEFWASLIMVFLAMIYTVTSGLSGVVWTDVFQGFFIFVAIVIVCIKGLFDITIPESFTLSAPLTDGTFFAYNTTWASWNSPFPAWKNDFPANSTYASYNMFGIALMLYFTKLVVEGFGGPTSYGEQRYFAAKNEKEASMLTGLWIVLLSFRWPFIISIVLYGIYYGNGYGGEVIQDPEVVLPKVIAAMMPVGVKGIVVGAMVSAAMSTFDSIVNAASATFTKDIYLAFVHPRASPRVLIFVGRISGIVMVAIGLAGTLIIRDINEIWGWVTMSLGTGIAVPLVMRFYWWRVNGYGYAGGLLTGTIAALVMKLIFTLTSYELPEYYVFVIVSAISFCAVIAISLLTPKTDHEQLVKFYNKVKPFGFWGPFKQKLPTSTIKALNKESIMDIFTLAASLPWQILNYLFFITLVLQTWLYFSIIVPILFGLYLLLYFIWFRRIMKPEQLVVMDKEEEEQET